MKLDYASLLSPYPIPIRGVGSVKSPRLSEIWNPAVTYRLYSSFLSLLSLSPAAYCEQAGSFRLAWYQSLPEDQAQAVSMFDLIVEEEPLQAAYSELFQFFLEEQVFWDETQKVYWTYLKQEEETFVPTGSIHRENFYDLCDVILQRCGMSSPETEGDLSRVKNKRAARILSRLQQGRKSKARQSAGSGDLELSNLISAVACKSNSVNFINIWDLTVYQLYDLFQRMQTNVYFDIRQMSVAAWGDKENTFHGDEWYRNAN